MITGSYGARGRPYVQGRLVIPRLSVDGYLDMLVDTVADSTTIHTDDAKKLTIPFRQLKKPLPIDGIGGSHIYYHEPAVVVFVDGKRL